MIEGGSGSTLLRLLEKEGENSKTMTACPQALALLLVILHRCQHLAHTCNYLEACNSEIETIINMARGHKYTCTCPHATVVLTGV
jgi:hypothetical protein